jgi:hypothetical protein
MSSSTYFAVENQVLNNVKEVAINEMIDAGQEELRLALEAGEVDSNGVGMITVIVDGAWSKRSYKTHYNALSAPGVASIIGARSKKVLYIGIKNKYCRICEKFAKLKKKAPSHKCFKNWKSTSTSMEIAIILEGFKNSSTRNRNQKVSFMRLYDFTEV